MSANPSQIQRVLALLRSRPEGLNVASLQELPTLDGGPPVLRLAARIRQLREAGYTISSRREKNGTSTYQLVGEPEVERALATGVSGGSPGVSKADLPAPAEPQGLFDPVGFTERGDFRDVA